MVDLRYNKDLGEPDNAVRVGVRLEKMGNELYNMIHDLQSVISDASQSRRRYSESPTLGRFRHVAQQYIERATEFHEQYPSSVLIKEYLHDITRQAKTLLERIEEQNPERRGELSTKTT